MIRYAPFIKETKDSKYAKESKEYISIIPGILILNSPAS